MSEPYDVLRAYIDEPVGWSNENDTAAQDAARIALGLASEEVRELRAEVARLTEGLREVRALTFEPPNAVSRIVDAALSPASTEAHE